ncbi:MAG TPA: folate-binding protein [Nitrosomonas sp.]|nr:folate-binding protein [Nitrosomonas sp.]HMW21043.1 folate-binding protein [Nitrosomonas sp.]HMW69456.1 folate-binding protein [Nitrosomonas sp.]HMY61749.1 folate-binding protein [Nitrosomonas sp.]HMY90788.1 folate-binding protein [Nitrosomonas sp.]
MNELNQSINENLLDLQKIPIEKGVVDLSDFGIIRFTGEDTLTFLQGQLSCDVLKVTPTQAQHGCYCSPKGRILANFILAADHTGEAWYMQMPRAILDKIVKRLSMYVLRAKVKLVDYSAESIRLGIVGSQAHSLLEKSLPTLTMPESRLSVAQVAGITVICLGPNRFEMIAPFEQGNQLKTYFDKATSWVNLSYWQWLDIQAGIPTISTETQEQFIPQMVNMDLIGGISFQKGCYPGQEIVARTQYLGKLKRRMTLIRIETTETVAAGDPLYSESLGDQACGMIVNAVRIAEGIFEALAVIPIDVWNSSIQWKSLQGPIIHRLTLPYSLPEKLQIDLTDH